MDACGDRDTTGDPDGAPVRTPDPSAVRLYSAALFAILMIYYGGLYFLWSADSQLYTLWMKFIGVQAWEFPFLDIIAVLSWGDCHHAGFDVLQVNPCDPLNRLLVYSPVLLDLPIHWLGVRHATAVGLTIDLAFLAMLPVLLRPNSWRALAICLLACLSPAVVFAVERANFDVFVLTVIGAAALYATRGATQRLVSYGVYLAVGLLKIYPLVLLGLIARERPRIALACAAAAGIVILAFAAHYWHPFKQALALIQTGGYFGDMFGAVVLPFGVTRLLRLPSVAGPILFATLLAVALLVAVRLARRLGPELSAADWDRPSFMLLAVGSALTVGCFLAGMNVGYRVSILLFVIPGLLALRGRTHDSGTRFILAWALGAALCCMWRQFFESGLFNLGLVRSDALSGLVFLVLREAAWWSLVSILAAFLVAYLLHSPLWRALTAGGTRAVAS